MSLKSTPNRYGRVAVAIHWSSAVAIVLTWIAGFAVAEVAPPGVCAMPKVSGSRIATPLAPPRPGSTPMITPRMTPMNMKSTLYSESATTKPCASAWISATQSSPRKASIGPLGRGTRNQRSKMRKNTTEAPMLTATTFHQANLPSQRMKKAMNTIEET